ncbi:MAG: TonB family protein [Acidobacteria bacterium]|nr:TonB family protein [Acidobacteriota bacterium]
MQKTGTAVVTILLMLATSLFAFGQEAPERKPIIGGVLNGKAISLPKPTYPEDARAARVQGTIKVQIVVDESGKVISAKTLDGVELPSMRAAAEAAALNATFSPTLLSGQPVKVQGVIEYDFVFSSTASNEKKMAIMGLGTFIYLSHSLIDASDEVRRAFLDDEEYPGEDTDEFPELKDEIEVVLGAVSKMDGQTRPILELASSRIESKLKGDALWQFSIGRTYGSLMGCFVLTVDEDGPDPQKLDAKKVSSLLIELDEKLKAAPASVPEDVLQSLRSLASESKKTDLTDLENFKTLFAKMMVVLYTISPESLEDEDNSDVI